LGGEQHSAKPSVALESDAVGQARGRPRAIELPFQASARAMQPHAYDVRGHARNGSDLLRRETLPCVQREELAVPGGQAAQSHSYGFAPLVADRRVMQAAGTQLVRQPLHEPVPEVTTADALTEQVASHTEEPEPRLVSGRNPFEAPPRDEVRLGHDVRGVFNRRRTTKRIREEVVTRFTE